LLGVKVLRLGHRAGRDDRISTHVGLVARQYGVEEVVFCGQHDSGMMESVRDVGERWGKGTEFRYSEDWRSEIRDFNGFTVHLTMYGLSVDEEVDRLRSEDQDELQLVVGSEKVPREVYRLADLNLAVGHQPHSEIAALAVVLDRVADIERGFDDADIGVEPSDGRKLTSDG
jgi:tRNA (cytidine56-2'-O)-methyltransferase